LGGNFGFGFMDLNSEATQWGSGASCDDLRFSFMNSASKKVIGAADGTLIPVFFREDGFKLNTAAWINRKGFLSTNVLAVCRHDKTFSKVFVGASGCCNDQTVVNKVELEALYPGLALLIAYVMPSEPYCLLFDGGVRGSEKIITPFPGTRSHLPEFKTSSPQTAKELFNYLLSVKRSRVEIAFGLLKGRWSILRHGVIGKRENVFLKISACFSLHNFVQASIGVEDTMQKVASQVRTSIGAARSLAADHQSDVSAQDTFSIWRETVALALFEARQHVVDDSSELVAAAEVLSILPDEVFRA
jgi:hypothetical protein